MCYINRRFTYLRTYSKHSVKVSVWRNLGGLGLALNIGQTCSTWHVKYTLLTDREHNVDRSEQHCCPSTWDQHFIYRIEIINWLIANQTSFSVCRDLCICVCTLRLSAMFQRQMSAVDTGASHDMTSLDGWHWAYSIPSLLTREEWSTGMEKSKWKRKGGGMERNGDLSSASKNRRSATVYCCAHIVDMVWWSFSVSVRA